MSCTIAFLQVTNSEWVLGVQIQHFENVYGLEIRNSHFCCCDDGTDNDDDDQNDVSLCVRNITDLQMCKNSTAYNPCDTYFLVYVRDCLYNSTCNYTQTYQLKNDTTLIQLTLTIPVEME